jgi:hypothetical protein
MGKLEAFRDMKNEAGEPLNPFFDDVVDDMVLLANNLKQKGLPVDLKQIYEKAVRLNDTAYKKLMEKQEKEKEKTSLEQAKAKADAAKRSSKSLVSKSNDSTVVDDTRNLSVREILERTLN